MVGVYRYVLIWYERNAPSSMYQGTSLAEITANGADTDLRLNTTIVSVYKTLCPQHMLAPNTNLENMYALIDDVVSYNI